MRLKQLFEQIDETPLGIAEQIAKTVKNPFDKCKPVSLKLFNALTDAGFGPDIVRMSGLNTYAPNADPRWLHLGSQMYWTHYAVLCDGIVYDLTRKQFFPEADPVHAVLYESLGNEWLEVEIV